MAEIDCDAIDAIWDCWHTRFWKAHFVRIFSLLISDDKTDK